MPNTVIIDYDPISSKKKLQSTIQTLPHNAIRYVIDLFPLFQWIHRYNFMWLVRDLIAGITVGIVVVPQSMGYAKLAELPPEYGLYTAFVGLCMYCFFGTSKDISIGPTAVVSLLLGQIITQSTSSSSSSSSSDALITGPAIAATFSLLVGATTLALGLVRLGILVEFIPGPVIAGFITGSAITIIFSQLKSLTGISELNTQDPAYLILAHFFEYLPHAKLDVAFGLIGLVWLYGVQYSCKKLAKRYPQYADAIVMFSIMRNGILVISGTLVAFLIHINRATSPIQILQTVPAGFRAMGVPSANATLVGIVAPSVPSAIIILVLEHLAIAKSFGRINDYTIRPSQEIVAIGFVNIISSFFGGYPSTGSFSRTAIVSRSGVKTPLSGIFGAAVVLLALYALTPAFYYIPNAILAAVVIHAVANLMSGPSYLVGLYRLSLWDLAVFVIAVGTTLFISVDYGIYAAVGISTLLLLARVARPTFEVLGRIPLDPSGFLYLSTQDPALGDRVQPLPDGILLVRVAESMTYPNASFVSERIVSVCKEATTTTTTTTTASKQKKKKISAERVWNEAPPVKDPGSSNNNNDNNNSSSMQSKPVLSAVVFDMTGVNRIDSSGVQGLHDAQHALTRYSGHPVAFHFAGIINPSLRQALLVSGFGDQPTNPSFPKTTTTTTISSEQDEEKENRIENVALMPLPKDRYPFFHWSLDEAIQEAVVQRDQRRKEEEERRVQVIVEDPS